VKQSPMTAAAIRTYLTADSVSENGPTGPAPAGRDWRRRLSLPSRQCRALADHRLDKVNLRGFGARFNLVPARYVGLAGNRHAERRGADIVHPALKVLNVRRDCRKRWRWSQTD
jgi:hypothetical protein